MRIRTLALDFFGLFTGKVLDFGDATGASDFHVIYGPNEAGKTTTMEGFLRLLFGFQRQEPYSYRHQRKNLQISGEFDLDGEHKSFTRRPTRTGDLLGEAGAAVPENALSAHLGGMSPEMYRSLLCLDDETIEKGGEDIANARGDTGRLLFSAAAGVANLNAVIEKARRDADGLYRKKARNTRLAALKRHHDETTRLIRDADTTSGQWRKLRKEVRDAAQREKEARNATDELRLRQAQTAALRRALPHLLELDRVADEASRFTSFPETLDVDPEDLVSLRTDQSKTEAEIGRLRLAIRDGETKLENIWLDEDQLALKDELDELDDLRSRVVTAGHQLPRLRRTVDDAESEMSRVSRDLGVPEAVDPQQLVKSQGEISALEAAHDRMRTAVEKRESAAREIPDLEARVDDAKATCANRAKASPGQGILALLADFDVDALAPKVAVARQAIDDSDERLANALEALSVGNRAFSEVPTCPVDLATVDDIAESHLERKEQERRAEEALATCEEEMALTKAQIAGLTERADVVSDRDATDLRKERDAAWRAHRQAMTPTSADAFEAAMHRLDNVEASRIVHVRELEELRHLERRHLEAKTRADTEKDKLAALQTAASEEQARVSAITDAIGLPPVGPERLRDWMKLYGEGVEMHRRKRETAKRYRSEVEQGDRLREALRPLLGWAAPSLEVALDAARTLAEKERSHQDEQRRATEALARAEEELGRHQSALRHLASEERAASGDWVARVTRVLGEQIVPDALNSVLALLRELREHDATRRQAQRQVSQMQADVQQFAENISKLVAKHRLGDGEPQEMFHRLRTVADKATEDKARRDRLRNQIESDNQGLRAAEAQLSEIHRQVRDHAALFPKTVETKTLDALRDALRTGLKVIGMRERIAELGALIVEELSVHNMAEARGLLVDRTPSSLEAASHGLEADLARAENDLHEAIAKRAQVARDLSTISGDAEVAALVERRTTLQLEIEDTALEYLETEFGLRLADTAIRRYRDKYRSEMMKSTESAFCALTNGAYPHLKSQAEGSSEVLLAVDTKGTAKRVKDLSKSTRFQLYLALRAAAYEQLVSQGIRLPFFCDDVFETFDEDRTRAACLLMERIGRRGQAIYLTHHRHVVEIAKDVCDVQPRVHNL